MKIKLLFTTLLLLTASLIYAQVQHDNDTVIFIDVEEPPTFPGGDSALVAYLKHNLHYPPAEKKREFKAGCSSVSLSRRTDQFPVSR